MKPTSKEPMSKPSTSPPPHLSARSKVFWRLMVNDYALDDPPARELLMRCCDSMDRADSARTILSEEGLTVTDRYGQVKPHPAAGLELQSRTAVARLLRELRVLDPPEEERPPRMGRR